MPIKYISLGTTEEPLLEADNKRTGLGIANNDDSAVIFVSDEQGMGVEGFPVFPKSYISLSKIEGFDVTKKLWGIADTTTTPCHIITGYVKTTPAQPPAPDIQEPNQTVDPVM